MFAVFAAFVPEGDASIQPIAFGLAVGVADRRVPGADDPDSRGARACSAPGRGGFQRWLDRVLPRFDVEGEGLAAEFALADWPSPDADLAIAADDVRVAGAGAAPIDAMVGVGEALVVHGGSAAERSALLLALGGRVAVTAGRLKVDGLVVPARASTVRSPHRVRAARVCVDRVRVRSTTRSRAAPASVLIDAGDGIGATARAAASVRASRPRAKAGRAHDRRRRRRPGDVRANCCRPTWSCAPCTSAPRRSSAAMAGVRLTCGPQERSRRRRARATSAGSPWPACSRCR